MIQSRVFLGATASTSKGSLAAARPSLSAVVLTMVPNGGAATKAMKTLGYTPYTLEDTFTKGRALTHPQEWLTILEGQKEFNGFFLNRTSRANVTLPDYDCIIGPPATLAYETILQTCPLSTRVILLEEQDKSAWARDMEMIFATISNYKNHSGPGFILYRMMTVMMDFYRCTAARRLAGKLVYRQRTTAEVPSAERLAGSLELFEEHVKATVPSDRLLVYRIGDGWEPLCHFLGVDVPMKDGVVVDFPAHDNGLEAFVKIRDALSVSRRVVAIGVLVILSLTWVLFSYALSEFQDELKRFYQYTRKRFEPYFAAASAEAANKAQGLEEEGTSQPSIGFRKAMVLAKKSALEYGEELSKDAQPRNSN